MSRASYQIELLHPLQSGEYILTPAQTHNSYRQKVLHYHACRRSGRAFPSFCRPLLELLGGVMGCRSKVTGQDVAVVLFPLHMCSSVTLATTLREVVFLGDEEETERERKMLINTYKGEVSGANLCNKKIQRKEKSQQHDHHLTSCSPCLINIRQNS